MHRDLNLSGLRDSTDGFLVEDAPPHVEDPADQSGILS
jgi:hypothetical protein